MENQETIIEMKEEYQKILDQTGSLTTLFFTLTKMLEDEMKNYVLFTSKNLNEKKFEKTKTAYIETLKGECHAFRQLYKVHSDNYIRFVKKCLTKKDFEELMAHLIDSMKNLKTQNA